MPNIRLNLPDKKWFYNEYKNNKKGIYVIAKSLGCSPNTVYRRLKLYNIEIFSHSFNISGERHPNWKGGIRKTKYGYTRIYKPEHPNADSHKTVYEHRLIMEKKLGRYLNVDEVVHHLNGIKNDNREENLVVLEKILSRENCRKE